jgi:hypothetical protein
LYIQYMAMLNIFIEFIDGPYPHNQYRGWPIIIYEFIQVADIYISAKHIYGTLCGVADKKEGIT